MHLHMKHLKKNRIVIFVVFMALILSITRFFTDSLLPTTGVDNLWFYSGLFMVLFSVLFIEPYYSSPKNVITNAVPLLLVFLAIKPNFENEFQWWLVVAVLIGLIIASIVSITLADTTKSPDSTANKISTKIKNTVVILGRGKVLYSAVFLYFLFMFYINSEVLTGYTFFLLIAWALILLINPSGLHSSFRNGKRTKQTDALGEIFSVQSNSMFLVRLFDDKTSVGRFDLVKFRYSMQDDIAQVKTGIVFDYYLLNQEKWAKIVELGSSKKLPGDDYRNNIIYKVTDKKQQSKLSDKLRIKEFVGVVIEGSTIGKLRFEYSKMENNLTEGNLLELRIGKKRLFYQVVSGITNSERLEARNESGFVESDAIQLGTWDDDRNSFNKFGWVPEINTPIFLADTSDITPQAFSYPEYKIGVIPNTSLPSIMNLDEAINHHMALIGVTGSGKTFIANEIIQSIKIDTRVIIVDFTGEWKKMIDEHIALDKDNIDDFLATEGETIIGIVELPDFSNTTAIIEATERLLSTIFNYAKGAFNAGTPTKICLVLEEAHTIVPEASFLGVNNWDSKAIVNKMGQIALQGRKYGVGLLVIAQRTANVSKTVLTQCNTVVCFQAFDETSFNFLGNYVGKNMVDALPTLPRYQAIVAGKASKSNVPMIVDLER